MEKRKLSTRIGLIIMAVLLIWMAATLVRVENQRYAMQTGICIEPHGVADLTCLSRVETRTGWWWHLFYALTNS